MRWRPTQRGDWRIVRRFAYLPERLGELDVWLEHFWTAEVYNGYKWRVKVVSTREEAVALLNDEKWRKREFELPVTNPPPAEIKPMPGALSVIKGGGELSEVK